MVVGWEDFFVVHLDFRLELLAIFKSRSLLTERLRRLRFALSRSLSLVLEDVCCWRLADARLRRTGDEDLLLERPISLKFLSNMRLNNILVSRCERLGLTLFKSLYTLPLTLGL